MNRDASPPRSLPEAASGSTSGSRVLGEFGLAVGALLITLCVVTGLALLLTPFGIEKPGKIARKLTVPLFIIIYMVFTRLRLRSLPRLTTLIPLPPRPVSSVLKGFAAGAAALALLILIQFLPGWREVRLERTALELCWRAAFYFVGSVCVLGVLEESLFRGVLYHRLQRAGGAPTAILLGSAMFAVAHFLRPGGKGLPGIDGVWEIIPGCLGGLLRIPERWPEVVGLFMVGLVLSIIRWRTGSIFTCIGVHGGWVWIRKMNSRVTDDIESLIEDKVMWTGTNKFYDGAMGWAALGVTLLVVLYFSRPPAMEPGDQATGAGS